jgi:uncharacterized coiled-coil protein SlyX
MHNREAGCPSLPPKRNHDTRRHSCFNARMSELSERLETIETHLAHLERQYEQLNEVVIAQGRLLARLQKENERTSEAMQTMELEKIRANNPKPPHYQ